MKLLEVASRDSSINELRNAFIAQGYLYIKYFFDVEQVLRLRAIVTDALVKHGWANKVNGDIVVSDQVHRIGSEAFYQVLAEIMSQEKLHSWAYQPHLQALLREMLGTQVFAHPRKMVRISYPLDANPMDLIPGHQDIYYVRGEVDTFTVWTPLGNYSPRDGGLEVAHDSHKCGIYSVGANEEGRFGCTVSDVDDSLFDWRVGNYEIGDVLIMHSLTLHKARPNRSKTFRLSIDCRFSAANGRINRDQLRPPYFPNLPDWDQLTKGWGNKHLFDPPTTLQIDAPDMSLDDMISKPSILETCHAS